MYLYKYYRLTYLIENIPTEIFAEWPFDATLAKYEVIPGSQLSPKSNPTRLKERKQLGRF